MLLELALLAESTLMIGGWSHHFDGGEYNESHEFVGIEYKGFLLATYENSYYKRSNVIGFIPYSTEVLGANAGLMAGFVTGYEPRKYTPFVLPYVDIQLYNDFGMRLSGEHRGMAVTFTWKF